MIIEHFHTLLPLQKKFEKFYLLIWINKVVNSMKLFFCNMCPFGSLLVGLVSHSFLPRKNMFVSMKHVHLSMYIQGCTKCTKWRNAQITGLFTMKNTKPYMFLSCIIFLTKTIYSSSSPPLYLPDLALYNFSLFLKLTIKLKRERFTWWMRFR